MDPIAVRRKLAEAKKSLERAERYAGHAEEEWDEITAVERVPEFEAQGPGGFRIRLSGLGGAHFVAALALIAVIAVIAVAFRACH